MNHPIEATVLRVEFTTTSGKATAFNFPVFPWDDLKQIKADMRTAAAQAGQKITRLYKTKRLIENPLLK